MWLWDRVFRQTGETEAFGLPDGIDSRVGLIASPDSARLAYAVSDKRGGAHVEVNGRRFPTYYGVSGVTFSPDSRRLAYVAKRRKGLFVVCDELKYGPHDDIGKTSPTFSPNSKRIAYTARRGTDWFAYVDGKCVGGPYEGVLPGGIVLSQDSQRWIYMAKKGASCVAVVDGVEHQPFPGVCNRTWGFSPDSRRVAYTASVKGTWVGNAFVGEAALVLDGQIVQSWMQNESTKQDGLSSKLYFSPDSKRIAYAIRQSGKSSFVIDGVQQPRYDAIVSGWPKSSSRSEFPDYGKASWTDGKLVFSPDSKHFAYAVRNGSVHLLIYDARQMGAHQRILAGPAVFSRDSRRFTYGVEEGSKQMLVLDGKAMEHHDGLPPVEYSFSPCSKHVAYFASNGRHNLLVVDSQSWVLQGGPVIGARPVWDDSRRLHTLVGNGRAMAVARIEIP